MTPKGTHKLSAMPIAYPKRCDHIVNREYSYLLECEWSARPSVREISSSIPTSDLKSFFKLTLLYFYFTLCYIYERLFQSLYLLYALVEEMRANTVKRERWKDFAIGLGGLYSCTEGNLDLAW